MLRDNRHRRAFIALVVAVLALAIGWQYGQRAQVAWNARNLVRFHVVAHSEARVDQEAKLAVRDTILAYWRGVRPSTVEDAAERVKADLPHLEELAQAVLRAHDLGYEARARWGTFSFPTCSYGRQVLPAGRYQALRVVLGAGRGENWWCVLFPPLCFLDTVAAGSGEAPAEVARQVSEAPPEVRLWLVERLARHWPSLARRLRLSSGTAGRD